ncbi:elongation factor P hydroxylase [Reinekea blandensis]|uniref:Transporting ATPase n=1 Tax=Reinekea blandensis MED297 TaxID=314283 RepID=A4BHZ6_9GAMM|nr:elongation factor P hydroxylase [Reinekea blandensis]EAR08268.1 hypothetical protein MED297_13997 [Reinekea sp. MED297] [Reinekea blandensis MED297]
MQTQFQTCLVAAVDEPLYLPMSDTQRWHEIQFAHGYFNSALHELAHWCVAGFERRQLTDYGYWYEPDGRTAEQQREFERVEVRPQAIEWHLTLASNRRFQVSVDNLSGEPTDAAPFRESVRRQAWQFQENGLPDRAQTLVGLISQAFGTDQTSFSFGSSATGASDS